MKGMKCKCGKIAKYVKHLKFNGHDIDGWKCESCKEIYYNPEKAEKILLLNKFEEEFLEPELKPKFVKKLKKIKKQKGIRFKSIEKLRKHIENE